LSDVQVSYNGGKGITDAIFGGMQPVRVAIAMLMAINSTMVASCAVSRSEDGVERAARPPRRSSTLITRDELLATNAPDAYQAVERLHPDWLRGRGLTSLTGPAPKVLVYLDGQRLGEVAMLTRFTLNGIKEIRFHNASDATQRWGTGHSAGVIEVVTQTGS
jgi:hypothetical protein